MGKIILNNIYFKNIRYLKLLGTQVIQNWTIIK